MPAELAPFSAGREEKTEIDKFPDKIAMLFAIRHKQTNVAQAGQSSEGRLRVSRRLIW